MLHERLNTAIVPQRRITIRGMLRIEQNTHAMEVLLPIKRLSILGRVGRSAPAAAVVTAKESPTALIVNPDQVDGKRYVAALFALGIRGTLALTSKQAIRHCKQKKFDVLISQAILGENTTGYELVANLSKVCSVPVLIISKYPLELIRSVRGFDNEIARLTPPFTPEDVARRADRLLRGEGS